ncbi:hypothetical protein THIOM_003316, partial [Candidatus Thiomargarita nelsonii]
FVDVLPVQSHPETRNVRGDQTKQHLHDAIGEAKFAAYQWFGYEHERINRVTERHKSEWVDAVTMFYNIHGFFRWRRQYLQK